MIVHVVRHARTLRGISDWFDSVGFQRPDLQAWVSAAVEIVSGGALVAGAATPIAAAAVIGTMGVAIRAVHAPNGFFVTGEGTAQLAAFWRRPS